METETSTRGACGRAECCCDTCGQGPGCCGACDEGPTGYDVVARELGALARRHLAGIEGGLAGAVADRLAGASLDAAAGLGDSWGELPPGVSRRMAEDAVRSALRYAVALASEEG